MRTTIDRAGRIVIPKALRSALGLSAGGEVEVALRDGRIEIEPAAVPMHLEDRDGVPVAVPERPVPPLTADMVRETLEQIRR